jgi:NitT/TauT family transport system substrate-binding protein
MMQFSERGLAGIAIAAALTFTAFSAHAADVVRAVLPHGGLWDVIPAKHAIEEGIYEKLGLDVKALVTRGSAESVQAVATGSADVASGVGAFAILAAYAAGAPVRIIGSEIIGSPDIFYYVKGDSPVRSIKDLAGKTVAYTGAGSSSHMVIEELLGANKSNVKLVGGGGFPAMFTQVMTGQVESALSIPPLYLDRVEKGEIRIIARGSEAASLSNMTVRVHIANANFLRDKRELARKYMMGFAQGIDWAYANQDQSVPRFAKAMGDVTPEMAKEAIQFYPKEALKIAPIQGVDKMVALSVQYNFLKEPLTEAQLKELIDIVYTPGG